MALPKALSSIKRFGTRYGRTSRHKFAAIERQQKATYKCPYCAKEKVKRVSMGIWQCKKCLSKFTGKAYTVAKKRSVVEDVKEEQPQVQDLGPTPLQAIEAKAKAKASKKDKDKKDDEDESELAAEKKKPVIRGSIKTESSEPMQTVENPGEALVKEA